MWTREKVNETKLTLYQCWKDPLGTGKRLLNSHLQNFAKGPINISFVPQIKQMILFVKKKRKRNIESVFGKKKKKEKKKGRKRNVQRRAEKEKEKKP